MGRSIVVLGLVLVVIGLAVSFGERSPFHLGRLPGDIAWRGKRSVVYFPLATSLLLSIVLSVVLWLIDRFK